MRKIKDYVIKAQVCITTNMATTLRKFGILEEQLIIALFPMLDDQFVLKDAHKYFMLQRHVESQKFHSCLKSTHWHFVLQMLQIPSLLLNLNLWRLHNQKIPHKLLLWWTFEHWNMYKAKKHLFQIKLLAFFVYKCTMRLFLNLQLLSTFFF